MLLDGVINKLDSTEQFLLKTMEGLEESDGTFVPKEGMFTLSQHVAHVAQTVDWFLEGMYQGKFNEDFEALEAKVFEVKSLSEAKTWLTKAFDDARNTLTKKGEEALKERLPPGPIMGGVPRYIVVGAISDHTAHHRGSIAVYIRLLGKEPVMPYE